ncbi:MAG: hypothetical protein LBF84_03280 [Holosporales bacterium]|jgi:hypothetical protein|nr:hypothetical protein [Holosporales bacterium]
MKKIKTGSLCALAGMVMSPQSLHCLTRTQRAAKAAIIRGDNINQNTKENSNYQISNEPGKGNSKYEEDLKQEAQRAADADRARQLEKQKADELQKQLDALRASISATAPAPAVPPPRPAAAPPAAVPAAARTEGDVLNALDPLINALNSAAPVDRSGKSIDLLAHLIIWSYDLLHPTKVLDRVKAESFANKVLGKVSSDCWQMVAGTADTAVSGRTTQLMDRIKAIIDAFDAVPGSVEARTGVTARVRSVGCSENELCAIISACANTKIFALRSAPAAAGVPPTAPGFTAGRPGPTGAPATSVGRLPAAASAAFGAAGEGGGAAAPRPGKFGAKAKADIKHTTVISGLGDLLSFDD